MFLNNQQNQSNKDQPKILAHLHRNLNRNNIGHYTSFHDQRMAFLEP